MPIPASRVIKSCRDNPLKDAVIYPQWVLHSVTESDSDKESDSDSEFKNLFKLIQMNEYDNESDSDKEKDAKETKVKFEEDDDDDDDGEDSETVTIPTVSTNSSINVVSKNVSSPPKVKNVEINRRASTKIRTPIIRPSLFLNSTTSKKGLKEKRTSTSASLSGAGNMAAMRIMFLQNALAENVEPIFRKKDRVYLSITPGDFNRCHKSESKKLADRVRRILNRNFIYLNDRDIAADLESKFERLIQNRITKKTKLMEDLWKVKDPFIDEEIIGYGRNSATLKKISLNKLLNYNMPHRDFNMDITKYVKRLRELAEYFRTDHGSSQVIKSDEVFDSETLINETLSKKTNVEYLLIPTEETYYKNHAVSDGTTEGGKTGGSTMGWKSLFSSVESFARSLSSSEDISQRL